MEHMAKGVTLTVRALTRECKNELAFKRFRCLKYRTLHQSAVIHHRFITGRNLYGIIYNSLLTKRNAYADYFSFA